MNNKINYSKQIQDYFDLIKETIGKISIEDVNILVNLLANTCKEKKAVYIMGNGGSASTASHFVNDFNKGLSYCKENKFRFICLNDNISTLTAFANDLGYEFIFVEQLKNHLQSGDLVIGISGSGNSKNVIRAIEYANEVSAITLSITGFDGGYLKKISNYSICVPINNMQITEDIHMILDHLSMTVLQETMK